LIFYRFEGFFIGIGIVKISPFNPGRSFPLIKYTLGHKLYNGTILDSHERQLFKQIRLPVFFGLLLGCSKQNDDLIRRLLNLTIQSPG